MWVLRSIQYLRATLSPSTTSVLGEGHYLFKQKVMEAGVFSQKILVTLIVTLDRMKFLL